MEQTNSLAEWINRHSLYRSYISSISDILSNSEQPNFKERLQYLLNSSKILKEGRGKAAMATYIARMIAYILQAQESSDKAPFNRLAKRLFDNVRKIMVARYHIQNYGLQNILNHVKAKVPTRTVLLETVENLIEDIITVNRNITSTQ